MSKIGRKKQKEEFIFPHASINRKPFGDTFHAKHSFIGGYVDRRLVDLASLYCVYTKGSKTELLRGLLKEKAKEFPSEKDMMENICTSQLDYWIGHLENQEFEEDFQYQYRKKKIWAEYKAGLKKYLYKTIPKYYANFVISYIEDAQF